MRCPACKRVEQALFIVLRPSARRPYALRCRACRDRRNRRLRDLLRLLLHDARRDRHDYILE